MARAERAQLGAQPPLLKQLVSYESWRFDFVWTDPVPIAALCPKWESVWKRTVEIDLWRLNDSTRAAVLARLVDAVATIGQMYDVAEWQSFLSHDGLQYLHALRGFRHMHPVRRQSTDSHRVRAD